MAASPWAFDRSRTSSSERSKWVRAVSASPSASAIAPRLTATTVRLCVSPHSRARSAARGRASGRVRARPACRPPAQPDERPRDHGSVFAGATEFEALLAPPPHGVVVARFERHERAPVQELALVEGRRVVLGRLDRMLQIAERLAEESAHGEEEPGRSRSSTSRRSSCPWAQRIALRRFSNSA